MAYAVSIQFGWLTKKSGMVLRLYSPQLFAFIFVSTTTVILKDDF